MQADAGYLAAPPGGGPGVLVLHAWWGLSDGIRRFCDQLAGEGFVALAPDLCDGRTARTVAEAEALIEQLDEDDLRGARRPVRFEVYPRVGHWFAEADRREAYDAAAAALAFRRTLGFLRSQLQKEAVTPLQER